MALTLDRSSLTVVVPVHNEAGNVRPFTLRIKPILDALPSLASWKIVFVNNDSEDATLDEILKLREEDERVEVITLSRNFGYHASLVAGLTEADGDLYAIIDVDGEDPPELLTQFYAALCHGAQVAYGIRSKRQESPLIMFFRRLFYYINRRIADSEVVLWMAEFVMITRDVRDAILAPRTTFPFLRTEIGYVGFKRVGVPYLRARREKGQSHYNFWRMARFAIGGFLASSTFPLRLIVYLGALLAVGFPLAIFWMGLTFEEASMWAMILGFYFLLFTASILGVYVARAYKNGVGRPIFVVDRRRTFCNAVVEPALPSPT